MEKKCMLARQEPRYSSLDDVPRHLQGSHREVDGVVWHVCAIAGDTARDLAMQLPPGVIAENTHLLWFDPSRGKNGVILGKPVPFHFTAGKIELLGPQEQVAEVAEAVAKTVDGDASEIAQVLSGRVELLREENRRLAEENAALEARRAALLEEIQRLMGSSGLRRRKSSKQ